MTEASAKIDQLRADVRERLAQLRTERDELRLRIHLMKAEVRDEWDKVDAKWEHFQAKAHTVSVLAGDAATNVLAAIKLSGEEIRQAYLRIRDAIGR
ncbi:MAG: hypothetical protein HYX63_12845 [Gammaproteobacteria bacterium]|nr:hypothetical protein [Gammaproteobacteria bacterium]